MKSLPGILGLLLAGSPSSPSAAGTLQGVVTDPQRKVVAGATVVLDCGASREERATGAAGEFAFVRAEGFAGCTVTASRVGFAPRTQAAGGGSPLALSLEIEPVRESLSVRPDEGEAGLSSYRSLASASIGGARLRAISDRTEELIRHARALAGASGTGADRVYVDGLPASVLPPADVIDRIVVNADPFSAEYAGDADGRIDILTAAPERKAHARVGASGLGFGGRHVLDPGAGSGSRSARVTLTAPVPHVPLTLSANAAVAQDRNDVPLRAVPPPGAEASSETAAPATTSLGSLLLALDYSRGETRGRLSLVGTQGRRANAGLTGTTLAEAATTIRSDARELSATFTTRAGDLVHRGGFVAGWSESGAAANGQGLGVSVSGTWTGGGAEEAFRQAAWAGWTLKYVVEEVTARGGWRAGATVARSHLVEAERLNPEGGLRFPDSQSYAGAVAGLGTGTWVGARGSGEWGYASSAASPFVEVTVLRSARAQLRTGLRADYQERDGVLLSPRVSGAATWRGLVLRGGGGLFVHDWPVGVLLRALENDRSHLDRVLMTGASFGEVAAGTSRAVPIDSQVARDLTRPRDLSLRASVERAGSGLTTGVEYTWTRTTHLLGSRRRAAGEGWTDTLESNRGARAHRVHVRLGGEKGGQRIDAHYEWTRSRDDTDGPFSFPESPDLSAEDARSAGVAPHAVSVVGSFRLPAGVSLTVVETYRSSAPYNVTTGADSAGNGLFNSRGGRARNSGDGPGYRALNVHCTRRVPLPLPGRGSRPRIYANVGVHVENVLDDANHVAVGTVAGSPLFGAPLVSLPGRAVRFTVSLDR